MPHINVRDLGRLREIGGVLVRHGFGHLIQGLPLEINERDQESKLPLPVRARQVLIELGPTFVKLGQVLSVRPDILPADFIRAFESLQDKVPPASFDQIKDVLEAELGGALGERFQSVAEKPIASASIAQVHKAVLRDGRTVAIKVQRPDIERRIRSDLHILYTLAHLFTGRLELPGFYTPVGVVQEFDAAINLELDFLQEARAIERFRRNFSDTDEIYAPEVHNEWTTRRVLVLELLVGQPFSELDPMARDAVGPVMDKVIEATYRQVFEHGFFHGDPHPGNLMLLDDGRLAYLDFGVTGALTPEMQDTLMSLFMSLVYKDAEGVALTLYRSGATDERVDLKGFKREIERLIATYHGTSLAALSDRGTLLDFVQVASRYRIRLVTEYAVLARTMSLLDGVARRFIPDLDIVAKVAPYAQRLFGQRMGPERLSRDAFRLLQQAQVAVRDVPLQMNQLVMDLQTGSIDIGIRDRDSERMRTEIRWLGIRLGLAMCAGAAGVTGALLLLPASSKLMIDKIPVLPTLGGIILLLAALMFCGLVAHTVFASRIHPREWGRRAMGVVRFFLPRKNG